MTAGSAQRSGVLAATAPVPVDRAHRYREGGFWGGRSLRDGLERGAERDPDALAVADDERCLSRGELRDAVAGAVGELRHLGVEPDVGVVLVTGNTIEGLVAYHALLRVGATIVLLDRRAGTADVRDAVDVVGGRAVAVVPSSERVRFDGVLEGPVVDLVELTRSHPSAPVDWSEPGRDTPRVVLMTSGTTGRPKAVLHSLDTLTAGADNFAATSEVDERSVACLVSPLASITGVMQAHLMADRHGALVLEDRFDPAATLDRMERFGATLLGGAPVIAERLLVEAEAQGRSRIPLRTLALGGSMLPRPLLELATDRYGLDLARVYGSSEAPLFAGSLPTDDRERRLGDDGAPHPGNEIRVGSREHPSEGLLRGPCLFLGYADPSDTEAAFEDGWYRTGDLVEVHDGRITVTGRLKEVVDRNGLKVALAEIDAAVAGLAGVVEHASFGVADSETGERVALAVRLEPGSSITLDQVVAHAVAGGTARRKLPEELVVWDEPLPRTASGKIIRGQLAVASQGRPTQLAGRCRE